MKQFVKKIVNEKVTIPVYMIAYTHLKNKVEVTNFYNGKYETIEEAEKAIKDYTFTFASCIRATVYRLDTISVYTKPIDLGLDV